MHALDLLGRNPLDVIEHPAAAESFFGSIGAEHDEEGLPSDQIRFLPRQLFRYEINIDRPVSILLERPNSSPGTPF